MLLKSKTIYRFVNVCEYWLQTIEGRNSISTREWLYSTVEVRNEKEKKVK